MKLKLVKNNIFRKLGRIKTKLGNCQSVFKQCAETVTL